MPDRPLTIATYAAGASLAAITLVYVFGPTFFLDDDAAQSSRSTRKKGVVGLYNPANDCFINSVLQTLAGLPELRVYLIRELHRRRLDGKEVYALVGAHEDDIRANEGKDIVRQNEMREPEWKVRDLQQGIVTAGLKIVLDQLNERPIYKKTISAGGFVQVLERAFRTRISRQQQDAQEFMQIVTERLSDEYYAGRNARRKARSVTSQATLREASERARIAATGNGAGTGAGAGVGLSTADSEASVDDHGALRPKQSGTGLVAQAQIDEIRQTAQSLPRPQQAVAEDEDTGFPFEGQIESQIECLHCHFKPKPSVSSFVTLTLNVPHGVTSTSLNSCFDGMFKVEHIDDFKCDRCRLQHALELKQAELVKSPNKASSISREIDALTTALSTDPEKQLPGITLPDISLAPKRRIARHMRISQFPRILAVHLSRSVWDPHSVSTKNLAKVSFPETLPLGGLLDQKSYRLLGVVTHKGGHNSGHYESFRRQVLADPYSTPASMGTQGVYSANGSPRPSGMPSPRLGAKVNGNGNGNSASTGAATTAATPARDAGSQPSTPMGESSESSTSLSSGSSQSRIKAKPHVAADADLPTTAEKQPPPLPTTTPTTTAPPRSNSIRAKSIDLARFRRKKKTHNRWWRISDDKVKESKTSDVLGMQRDVYLLFYEIDRFEYSL
ncbi:hypothetical protein MBLNU459_g1105t1 [Dothideomycetes sp. NU459]